MPADDHNRSAAVAQRDSSWAVLIALWITFLVYGAVAAPVPGVNEPHYLAKSLHYWKPQWCEQDFFLTSPNAHTVFFTTFGSLTQWGSFEQAAWAGRIMAMLLLAWGWQRGLSPLFFNRLAPLWSAWIYLALAACGNFSGEWLVGGIEGKVPCYALLLAALGEVLRHRPLLAATWAGLAVSFHPVVGLWGVLAYWLSQLVQWWVSRIHLRRLARIANTDTGREPAQPQPITDQPGNPTHLFVSVMVPWVLFFILALPGLIPVVRLLAEQVPPEVRYAATYLQVYFRLAHHLDPMLFPMRSYVCYGIMLVLWLLSFRWSGRTNSRRLFDLIVLWSVIFAATGIVIGLGPRPPRLMWMFAERMQLLKFYPFRLADVLLPVAWATTLVSVLERTLLNGEFRGVRGWRASPAALAMIAILVAALMRSSSIAETNRYSGEDRADWLDVCGWIDGNLPADALVQSPTNGWAFKWFARRAEYVAFKDCPQDAHGIVEWNRRLNFLQKWFEDKYADEKYSAEELRELRRLTGLTHLLTDRLGPLELDPVYRNSTFQVYDLRQLDEAGNSTGR